jgi:hypothetical protein
VPLPELLELLELVDVELVEPVELVLPEVEPLELDVVEEVLEVDPDELPEATVALAIVPKYFIADKLVSEPTPLTQSVVVVVSVYVFWVISEQLVELAEALNALICPVVAPTALPAAL